ncbi:MAG: hypothetical protein M3040_03135 [Bacteroidota bacterium]|nr:hypothetical protein [Bacteroidota bacterium]
MHLNFTQVFTVILFSTILSLTNGYVYAKTEFNYKNIKAFIPDDYAIFDTASGDFNEDGYTDYIIVLTRKNETPNSSGERPLLLLAGLPKGKFELIARNDQVVLCANCGGVFGDPYKKVSISGQLITVEHSVGGTWQWSRSTTFRYDGQTREILLQEDVTKSYKKYLSSREKTIAVNNADFGNLPFASYSYHKGFQQ